MKLGNFVPFGRTQSGTIIIQLMTELDVSNLLNTGTAIPKPPRKQSNALRFLPKIVCQNAHILKIYNRHYL